MKICTFTVLSYHDFKKLFIVEKNDSYVSVGVILCQVDNDESMHPEEYASRTIHITGKSYSLCEELSCSNFWFRDAYVIFIFFWELRVEDWPTEHQMLKSVSGRKQVHQRLPSWQSLLTGYRYKMRHRSGRTNHPKGYSSMQTGSRGCSRPKRSGLSLNKTSWHDPRA